jgi:dTDP-4-dehydrorhamnose reductase
MIQAVLARRPARVDNVLVRFPTWTRDVADALLFLLRREAEGVFHVSGPLGGTRYALTLEVARILGADAGHLSPSETILPRKAARPPNSALATEKIRAAGFAGFASFSSLVWHVCESVGIAPAG